MASDRKIFRESLRVIEKLGLVVILLATVVAIVQEIMLMIDQRGVKLHDLLMLFIYLEVLSMINIYYQSHRLPVRFPIYIAIVALARYVILDSKSLSPWGLLEIGAAILILALAIYVLRVGHAKYPYDEHAD